MSSATKALGILLGAIMVAACIGRTALPDAGTRSPASESVSPTEPGALASDTPTVPTLEATGTVRALTATAPLSQLPVCGETASIELAMMELAFVAGWDGDDDVYTISADGASLRQFTDNPGADVNPFWSGDGQQLAFVIGALENPRLYVSQADGSTGHIVAPELEVTTLQADLSPRGDLVAFRNLEDLYAVNILSGEATLLTPGPDINPGNPTFSPDGTKLLFTADDAVRDSDALFVVNADGTGLTKLTTVVKSVHQPAWHPAGDKILFELIETPSEGVALHVVSLDGSVQKLPIVPVYRASSAAWSPDGSMIGYIFGLSVLGPSGDIFDTLEKNVLKVATADGGVDLELLRPADEPGAELQLHELAWAPDSRHIAYTAVTEGRTDLFVLNICDGSTALIAEDVDFYSTPAWRPLP